MVNKEILIKIGKMNIEESGKILLKEIFELTSNSNLSVKQTVPSFLISGFEKQSAYEFAKVYGEILDKNKIFKQESHNRYLELKYSPDMTGTERKYFFQSIRNAALTSNKFFGVLLIDICEWNLNEIEGGKEFLELMEYLKENERNIRTIFVSQFEPVDEEEVFQVISRYIAVSKLRLRYPEVETIVTSAKKYLIENDLELSENAIEELENYIQKLQICKKYDCDDLRRILSKIVYEYKKDLNCKKNFLVEQEYFEKFLPEINVKKEKNRIGFYV